MEITPKIPIDLDRLQTMIKHDHFAYREEFFQQLNHYNALYQVLLQNPQSNITLLSKLVLFISNVVCFYNDVADQFSRDILHLLKDFPTTLNPSFLLTLCKCIVILRNNKVVDMGIMVEHFLRLFSIQNKSLRKLIFTQLIFQIRKASVSSSAQFTSIQNVFFAQFSEDDKLKQFLISEVTIELFHNNTWKNGKSVLLLQSAVLSKVRKISVNAVRFFIRPVYSDASDQSSSEDELPEVDNLKNRKRKNMNLSKKNKKHKNPETSFYAIDLVRDPFEFTTKLMRRVESKYDKFDDLLEKMALMGLLIWTHKLVIPQYFTFLQRYLKPHQPQVSRILTYLSQAAHSEIEASVLYPSVQTIISNFITDRNTPEAITVGINTIREIALKCSGIFTPDLLHDLTQYRKYKNKNVVMAARSLLQLFRYRDPELLLKKDRGKPDEHGDVITQMGSFSGRTNDFVPGILLLESDADVGEKVSLTSEKRLENARTISQTRILSQSEHETIRRKKADHMLNPKFSNQQLQLNYRLMKEKSEIISVSDVQFLSNKSKNVDVEEDKLMKKAGKSKVKLTPKSSVSNNKTRKNKNFMMISHGKTVSAKKFISKKKTYQAKNYKLKRILTKEYRKMRSSQN